MTEPLNDAQIKQALTQLSGWTLKDGKLAKRFTFGGFKEAMSFMVRVGMHAEELNHHPEIHNVYATVDLALCTHDAGDKVTQKDVALAQAIQRFSWVG